MSIKKYYALRYSNDYDKPFEIAEREVNRQCWLLVKGFADRGNLAGKMRTGDGMKETWFFDLDGDHHAGTQLKVSLSSGVFGNPSDANISVIGWTISNGISVDYHSMEHNVLCAKLNSAPCNDISINALYYILSGMFK